MKSISNASEVTNRKKSVTQELDDALERAEILAQGESLNKLYNISEILQDKMPWTKNNPRKIRLLPLIAIFLVVLINKGIYQLPGKTHACRL